MDDENSFGITMLKLYKIANDILSLHKQLANVVLMNSILTQINTVG